MKKNSTPFGAPGIKPRWTSSAKDGIGTAYHSASCIWFTHSHGIINEIYFPRPGQSGARHRGREVGGDDRAVSAVCPRERTGAPLGAAQLPLRAVRLAP